MNGAPRKVGWLKTQSGSSLPSARKRTARAQGAELVARQRGEALDADDDVGVDVGAQERRALPLTTVKGCMLMAWRRARARR
jgi:hypothetical protein